MAALTKRDVVEKVVTVIDEEPFIPSYRRRCFGQPVLGWKNRLTAYYWPNPQHGYAENVDRLEPILRGAANLACTLERRWTAEEENAAVIWARCIFEWGYTPQRPFSSDHVAAVIRSARSGRRIDNAPMNSGWSKVAAFATADLESSNGALAILDSRVANALVTRPNGLLHQAGIGEIPEFIKGIGEVRGRGGTRVDRKRKLKWRNGYRSWNAVFAASALVRDIRVSGDRPN